MAILSTVKKVIPYIKEAAGYVLCHISSQAVEMDDGTLLQDKIESMDSEIDGKANTSHTHTATQITGLTASRAMVSDGSGHPAVSNVTATELNYLDGATSNIQNQINTLNSKSFTQIHSYNFWDVWLTVWACGYLRYFCCKGAPENTFAFDTRLTSYADCEPVSGYTVFNGVAGREISFSTEGEVKVAGTGWEKGTYFCIVGMFVATQKIS